MNSNEPINFRNHPKLNQPRKIKKKTIIAAFHNSRFQQAKKDKNQKIYSFHQRKSSIFIGCLGKHSFLLTFSLKFKLLRKHSFKKCFLWLSWDFVFLCFVRCFGEGRSRCNVWCFMLYQHWFKTLFYLVDDRSF